MDTRPSTPATEADIDRFREVGFLSFERFIDAEALEGLRTVYDDFLGGEAVRGSGDRMLGGLTRQIMNPQLDHPLFAQNAALDAGRAIARRVLGCEAPQVVLQMLIYKGPGDFAETPWHQDFAYAATPFAPEGVAVPYDASVMFWTALDDVDEENGCMQFVPGAHLEPLKRHCVAGGAADDPARLLAIAEPDTQLDLRAALACPLPAGGATMHSFGTPHFTTGNRSADRPRRAYIFNFARPELFRR